MQLQDIDVRFFREDLIRFINSNPLPIEIKRLVLKEVSLEVSNIADKVIEQQRQVREVPQKPVMEEATKEIEKEDEKTEE